MTDVQEMLVLVALLVVVALQLSDYRVERITTIAASPAQVFPYVNDFHKREAWSPWAKLNPDAQMYGKEMALEDRPNSR